MPVSLPNVSPFVFPSSVFRVSDAFSPDRDGASYAGRGEIIPKVTSLVRGGRTLTFEPFRFEIMSDGSLSYVDEEGVSHSVIDLPANNIPGLTLDSGLQFIVRRWVSQGDEFIQLPEFVIDTPAGGVGTLSSLAPVDIVEGVPIIKGDQGDQGDTGATPKLVAGALTAVPADAELSFELVETEPGVYVINASSPRGLQGEPGAPGQIGPAGFQWRSFWDESLDYVNNDVVSFDGGSWFAAGDPPLGEIPSVGSLYWHALSLHGAQGARGPAGLDGSNALNPIFSFTAVSLPAGSEITVDQSGTYPDVSVALGFPEAAASTGGGGGSSAQVMQWRGYNNGNGGYGDNRYFVKRVDDRVFCRFEIVTYGPNAVADMINFYGGQMQGLRPLKDVAQCVAYSWAPGLETKAASMVMKTDFGNCGIKVYNLTIDPSGSFVPYIFEFSYVTGDAFPAQGQPTFFTPLPVNASNEDWAAI